ncbi:hypothetical protein LXM60_13875 [Pandoraea sputorum]|uniref:hypothetical protein n=1 Tax=Pandoraea sputorum TaxID=93222 RepID=UPI001E301208|nr:hypothetical protein [Pandoraea sputorum]MCE4061293.1 hypothetical protein [Pandoraea sputorum]
MENAQGNPYIIQSMPKVDRELQAHIMSTYESVMPGQVPVSFTYVPPPVEADLRGTVANVAGDISTAAGRFGAITAAGAYVPTPYAPALTTASSIATATGIVANAVVQMMRPDMGEYAVGGTVNFFARHLSDRMPGLSPAINETANAVNNSSAAKEAQAIFNNFWSRPLKPMGGSGESNAN